MGILLCNPLPSLRQVCNSWVSLSKQYAQNPAPGTHVDTEGSHTFNHGGRAYQPFLICVVTHIYTICLYYTTWMETFTQSFR